MTTTKHPQHRNSKRRNRAKRNAKKWAPAKFPAQRAAAKAAAEHVEAEQATAAFNPPEQAQHRKSLACRFGWHHWESRRAKAQRFRECTQGGRRVYYGWSGGGRRPDSFLRP